MSVFSNIHEFRLRCHRLICSIFWSFPDQFLVNSWSIPGHLRYIFYLYRSPVSPGELITKKKSYMLQFKLFVKPVLSGHSKGRPKIGFQDRYSLKGGPKYCRMLQESILQYFRPSSSYHLFLRPMFCLFETDFTVYLRNLPTPTVNNLLQKFENVKIVQFLLLLNTASNLCLLLQKEQNVKGGKVPSGKQAVGINNGTR